MQEKHIQLLQEQNPGLQDYLVSQFFITIFQILRLFGVVWDLGCLGLFWVVWGGCGELFPIFIPSGYFPALQSCSYIMPTGWI